MLSQEQLAGYFDHQLSQEDRGRVEELLTADPEAQRALADQENIHLALSVLFAPQESHERVKHSIFMVLRGASPEKLTAAVISDTVRKPHTAQTVSGREWFVRFLRSWAERLEAELWPKVALVALLLVCGVSAFFLTRPAPPVAVGQFAAVVGEPVLKQGTRPLAVKAQIKSPVHLGDRIETGDADKAELVFKDGTTLRLGFNTAIEIPKLKAAKHDAGSSLLRPPEISLVRGQVWTKVQKLTNAPQYAIWTEAATAVARGTEFGVKIQRTASTNAFAHTTVLTVKEGAVDFTNSLGSVRATAMTESTARADTRPTEPKRLQTLQVVRLSNSMEWSVLTSPLDWPDAAQRLTTGGGFAGLKVRDFPLIGIGGSASGLSNEVRVIQVSRESPAALAGIQIGDVVTAVDGEAIAEASQLSRAVLLRAGGELAVMVSREGSSQSLSLKPIAQTSKVPGPTLSPAQAAQVQAISWEWLQNGVGTNDVQTVTEGEGAVVAAIENNLGVLQEARDAMGPAIRAYGRGVRADPTTPLYRFNLGLALRKIGSLERAAEELGKAVELAPNSIEARERLAEVHSLLGDENGALAQTEAALQSAPREHGLWELKARILIRLDRAAEATKAARMAVETGPGCPVALGYLGGALQGEGDLAGAEENYRKALELAPFEPGLHVNLGAVLTERGQLDAAEQSFRKAIELQPDFELAWSNLGGLGITLAQQGNLAGGERLLRQACEFMPDSSSMNNNLGEVLRIQGRMDDAIPYFQKAMELDPNNPGPYNNLGTIHAMRKEFGEAERFFRGAIERAPDEVGPYLNLASVLGDQGKVAAAEPMFRKALATNPNDPAMGNALAYFLAEHQLKLDEALRLSRRAVQMVANNPAYLDTLGWVLIQRGEFDEAERVLKEGLRLAGDNLPANDIHEHLQKLEEKRNQPK